MTRAELLGRFTHREDRFGALLLLLVTIFVLNGITGSPTIRFVLALLNMATLMIAFTSTRLRRHPVPVALLAIGGTIGAFMVSTAPFNDLVSSIGASAQVAMLGVMTIAVLDRILRQSRVTVQTLAAAISAYFLIGQVYAWTYAALPGYFDGTVIQPSEAGQVPMYYSYVVLTTLGFGDVVPVGPIAERITVIEALTGQLYLATLMGLLISRFAVGRDLLEELE